MRGTIYTQFVGTFTYESGLRKLPWHFVVRSQYCKQMLIKKKKEEVGDDFELVMARSTYMEIDGLGPRCMWNYIEWKTKTKKSLAPVVNEQQVAENLLDSKYEF